MTGEASTLIGYYSDDIYKICQFSKQNGFVRIYKLYWINQMLLSRYLWQTRYQNITFNLTKTCLKFNQHKFDTISLQQASISQVVSISDVCTLFETITKTKYICIWCVTEIHRFWITATFIDYSETYQKLQINGKMYKFINPSL